MRLLANVEERIDAHSYPATTEELVEEYGDLELELPNGEETFGDALGRLGETTFEDAEDARLAAYSAVSSNAIGRQNYSDRDAPSIGENGPEQVSF
ncbi:uncharacterized protein NP_0720A [Natronomonas pharaonis DSM 2160]|uniref:Uncharacterized protein n=1 Tax=Natronomonas pharaonis (strain ATCC 35678 / DSM 2160 / CIP 103997 / JCM 8858 / NBRC 14720 / NCIMB 2260 / Gabara) TaxID=348780 RepID=A0A1U7EU28_NATPD|nr:hypothetical protein [Natronomonas pharaonis]CAI48451.2 uncharacterized protein NP_0720A [Natronomonas pharaonis DSM 2160]